MSQPALSRQIRDLEDEIGFLLLQRSAKSVRLTDAGRVFLAEARERQAELEIEQTNKALEQALDLCDELDPQRSGALGVAVSGAGVYAENKIRTDVKAYADGDGATSSGGGRGVRLK